MVFAGFNYLTFAREEYLAQMLVWIQFTPGVTDFVVLASGVVEIVPYMRECSIATCVRTYSRWGKCGTLWQKKLLLL